MPSTKRFKSPVVISLLKILRSRGIHIARGTTTVISIKNQLINNGIIPYFDATQDKDGLLGGLMARLKEANILESTLVDEVVQISNKVTQAFLKGAEEIGFDSTPAYINRELLKELLKVKNVDKYSDDEVKAAITAARKAAKEKLSRKSA